MRSMSRLRIRTADARWPALGSWLDRLVSVSFVIVLAAPAVLLASGMRPANIENRDPAPFPAVRPRAFVDPAFYAAIDRFLQDNLPLRTEAAEAHAEINRNVLGSTSNPDVVQGAGDWLFLRGEIEARCDFTASEVLERVDRAAAALKRTGRAFRYVVAPDKHAIYPDRLAPDAPFGTPCSDLQRPALQAGMLSRSDIAVELWTPTLKARSGRELVYYVQDSHWTPLGALPGIRALVTSLAPGIWRDQDITIEGTQPHVDDLANLIGLPRTETIPKVTVRPTVRVDKRAIDTGVRIEHSREIPWFTVRGDRLVVPGRTLFVYDSFYAAMMTRIAPWFEESVWVHEGDLRHSPAIASVIPPVDTVVFQRVERSAYFTDVSAVLRTVIQAPAR
jgi:acetyltransferase AlgX (SGNH hydrolase-like protein)